MTASFVDALCASGPAPDRAEKMGLYGQFVGRWDMDAVYPQPDGSVRRSRGEIHFSWALAGRAIQDVWIIPTRGSDEPPRPTDFYGTTLRVYDPGLDAWHILWIDPVQQAYPRMIGRARGRDIVQLGKEDSGAAVRWSFSEITPQSFRWTAERSPDDGTNWHTLVEFFARRISPAAEEQVR